MLVSGHHWVTHVFKAETAAANAVQRYSTHTDRHKDKQQHTVEVPL